MPEGFDPHTELARIHSLREVMMDCRRSAPEIIQLYRAKLDQLQDSYRETSVGEIILLGETILNRAYGKPHQSIRVNAEDTTERRVKVYLPDNGRSAPQGKVIDA